MTAKEHLIGHEWARGNGPDFHSVDPATGEVVWRGASAAQKQIDAAVDSARKALEPWSQTPLDQRIACLEAFGERVRAHETELAEAISRETGKPRWESLGEAALVAGKIALSINAYEKRRSPDTEQKNGVMSVVRFKPHGVVAVFGPFNLPAHLPNGHIVPALLAGNTVVFKPSELTPRVGQLYMELWLESDLPPGALNLVQGGRDVGAMLAQHPNLDGLFFTGSSAAGKALLYASADQPQKILALEMGGNNPLLIHAPVDAEAAACLTIQSAFITSGQRCTCARRLIVPRGRSGDDVIERLVAAMAHIQIGPWTDDPQPFMGPVVRAEAAQRLLDAQDELRAQGGKSIVKLKPHGDCPAMLAPGLMDVTDIPDRDDRELFGPFLQLIRVPNFGAAIQEANQTRFGLAAALFSDDPRLYQKFFSQVRAGVVNWNRPTTGASGSLPFGGVGLSGNHRPSGAWATDYCSYPTASIESDRLVMPEKLSPGLTPP